VPPVFHASSGLVPRLGYILRNMIQISTTTLPFIQATQDYVKGYVFERGFKLRCATTWLDKPQG
jgi:hypothetical protein